MEAIKLSNGIEMPLLGYGVFLVPANEEMTRIAALNQHDSGAINFRDPQFVKHLIQTYG